MNTGLPHALCRVFACRHTLCAHSQHFLGSSSDGQKSFHQVIIADLLCQSATETTSTISTFLCPSLSHILFRVNSTMFGGLTKPHSHTGCEFNSDKDRSGRFFPTVIQHVTMKTRILMCPTCPVSFSQSANVSSDSSASVTFSQAEGDLLRCSKSPSDTKPDRGKSFAITVSQYIPQGSLAVHGPQETVQLVTQRAQ